MEASIASESDKGREHDIAASPHAMTVKALLAALETDAARGLNEAQVARARTRYGFNELFEEPPAPRWRKLLGQFQELVIIILIIAAVISGLLGEWTDALAILAIAGAWIGCSSPGQLARIRGVFDTDRWTVSACESGAVYDLLLADTAHHGLYLRASDLEKRGAPSIIVELEGGLHG